MIRILSWFMLLGVLAVIAIAQDQSKAPLTVASDVDLNRYMGMWYEIARLPNWFQKKCVGEVTATYTLQGDGNIIVVNRCRKANGEYSEAQGRAKRASSKEPNTKLKVRFAPAWLSFLPMVWGDYWILILALDYTYAVIGEPERKYLWVLSRTPEMDEITLKAILEQVRQKGYDLNGLIRTPQLIK